MKNKKIIIVVLTAVCVIAFGTAYIFTGNQSKNNKDITFSTTEDYESVSQNTTFEQSKLIYVYVCGEVNSPGVVCLTEGARIYEAITATGGLTTDAEIGAVNQAELLMDGQMVYVPKIGEAYAVTETIGDGLININTATIEELMTLPGIGESRAADIISYRENTGAFLVIEDIMQVSGIKEAAFGKIKDYIKV